VALLAVLLPRCAIAKDIPSRVVDASMFEGNFDRALEYGGSLNLVRTSGLLTAGSREQQQVWKATPPTVGSAGQWRPSAHRRMRIAVYRIIGDALPPRHSADQLLVNLNSTLREPILVGAEKFFLLNRIVDRSTVAEATRLIELAGFKVVDVPFDFSEYRLHQALDGLSLTADIHSHLITTCSHKFAPEGAKEETRARRAGRKGERGGTGEEARTSVDPPESTPLPAKKTKSTVRPRFPRDGPKTAGALLRTRDVPAPVPPRPPASPRSWEVLRRTNAILYAMNNNGARNLALDDGFRRGFDWVLPFDGNCYFNDQQWRLLLDDLRNGPQKGLSYIAVNMVRHIGGDRGEPQVAFHRDARLRYNNLRKYSYRPKVELLWRLDVRGIWSQYYDSILEHEGPCYLKDPKFSKVESEGCRCLRPDYVDEREAARTNTSAAVVFRLTDGATDTTAKREDRTGLRSRGLARQHGISLKLRTLDARCFVAGICTSAMLRPAAHRPLDDATRPLFFNARSMEATRRFYLVGRSLARARRGTFLETAAPLDVTYATAIVEQLLARADARLSARPPSPTDKVLGPLAKSIDSRSYTSRPGAESGSPS